MVDQHEVLWNTKMIKVPLNYNVSESKIVNLALGQDHECVLLSVLGKCKLLLIHCPDGDLK